MGDDREISDEISGTRDELADERNSHGGREDWPGLPRADWYAGGFRLRLGARIEGPCRGQSELVRYYDRERRRWERRVTCPVCHGTPPPCEPGPVRMHLDWCASLSACPGGCTTQGTIWIKEEQS